MSTYFDPNQNLKAYQLAGAASAEEYYSVSRDQGWMPETAVEVVPVQHQLPCAAIRMRTTDEGPKRCGGHFHYDGVTRPTGPMQDITEYRHRCSGCGTGTWLLRVYPWISYEPAPQYSDLSKIAGIEAATEIRKSNRRT